MPKNTPSDVELMVRFSKGDIDAFEELVRRHQRSVVNTMFRLVGSHSTAEDLAQEVFLSIFKAGRKYKPTARFRTWLFRIVRNEAYNELRRRGRRKVVEETLTPGTSHFDRPDENAAEPFETMAADERAAIVRDAITKLPEAQRLAVVLRRYEGMTYGEIADAMETTVPAVKSLLARAKTNLTDSLGRHFKKRDSDA